MAPSKKHQKGGFELAGPAAAGLLFLAEEIARRKLSKSKKQSMRGGADDKVAYVAIFYQKNEEGTTPPPMICDAAYDGDNVKFDGKCKGLKTEEIDAFVKAAAAAKEANDAVVVVTPTAAAKEANDAGVMPAKEGGARKKSKTSKRRTKGGKCVEVPDDEEETQGVAEDVPVAEDAPVAEYGELAAQPSELTETEGGRKKARKSSAAKKPAAKKAVKRGGGFEGYMNSIGQEMADKFMQRFQGAVSDHAKMLPSVPSTVPAVPAVPATPPAMDGGAKKKKRVVRGGACGGMPEGSGKCEGFNAVPESGGLPPLGGTFTGTGGAKKPKARKQRGGDIGIVGKLF